MSSFPHEITPRVSTIIIIVISKELSLILSLAGDIFIIIREVVILLLLRFPSIYIQNRSISEEKIVSLDLVTTRVFVVQNKSGLK